MQVDDVLHLVNVMHSVNINMDKISIAIKQGEYSLVHEMKLKSTIWQTFGYVYNGNEKVNGVVGCFGCKKVYSYTGHKSGTSNLLRHKCESGQKSIASFFCQKAEAKKPKVSSDLKSLAMKKIVRFVTKDVVPFNVTSAQGFTELAQFLVDVGAKYGNVSVKELLPHPTTVSRHVSETANNLRGTVSEMIRGVFSDIGGGITLDLWSDSYRKINYMGVTVHYIVNGKLEERVLCTRELESDIKKTGEYIKLALVKILRSFDLYSSIDKAVFVTDRGSNVVTALRQYRRISCSAHILNTVLDHTTRGNEEDEGHYRDVQGLISSCRALTTFFKRSGLQNRLGKSLKGDVDTRWNSKLQMFDSINSQWDKILEVLTEKNQEKLIDSIEKKMLEDIIEFLTPFKTAADQLEASKVPTLYMTTLWKQKLLCSLEKNIGDSDFIGYLKEKAKPLLTNKWEMTTTHKLATYLHPHYKNLKFLAEADRHEVKSEARNFITSRKMQVQDKEETNAEPLQKKKKIERLFTEFEDMSDDENSINGDENDEISKYNSEKAKDTVIDLITWWRDHEDQYPYLSKLAYFIHSIPATSAPSERSFSTAGRVMQDRRTSLKPSAVDDIIFLNSNLPNSQVRYVFPSPEVFVL